MLTGALRPKPRRSRSLMNAVAILQAALSIRHNSMSRKRIPMNGVFGDHSDSYADFCFINMEEEDDFLLEYF